MTTQGLFRVAPTVVIFDGQSLNGIPGSPGSANAFPPKLMLNRGIPRVEVWVSGYSWAQLDMDFAERVAPYCKGALKVIYHMLGGTTDIELFNGTSCYNDMKTIAALARTAGATHVINTTIAPCVDFDAGEEAQRVVANNLVIGNAESAFDGIVNLTVDTDLENHASAAYSDGVHWTGATGVPLAVTYAAPVLDAILAL